MTAMIRLYPTPKSMKEEQGTYCFSYVAADGDVCQSARRAFNMMGVELTADQPAEQSAAQPANIWYIKKEGLEPEGYELKVTPEGAQLTYSDESGVMYGTQTLCQLIQKGEIPCLTIQDAPGLKERIFQLDISRGKIPTLEQVEEIIRYMAMARCNILSLYYDKPVIQFPGFEPFWAEDAYSLADLAAIRDMCHEYYIRLGFSVETFGHMWEYLRFDQLKHLKNSLDEDAYCGDLNPLDPRSLEFVDRILAAVVPWVETDYLKIGGDEVVTLGTGKSAEMVNRLGKIPVYMEYMKNVCDLVYHKYHKMPVMANDMFIKIRQTEEKNLRNLQMLPEHAALSNWGYESEYEYWPFDKYCAMFEKAGVPFVNTTSNGLYMQYVQRTYNMTLNAEFGCRSAYEHGETRVMQTAWLDGASSQFLVMEYEGMFIFGAAAWNPMDLRLSDVMEYLDRYVFLSENDSMALAIADIGDAAWYSKGKFPNTNAFAFAESCPFDSPVLWKGRHEHAGINGIHIWDAVDEYGCQKAIAHVQRAKERIEKITLGRPDGELVREKVLLNVCMFETAIRTCYMQLCIHKLEDREKALALSEEVLAGYDQIREHFPRLWLTEARPDCMDRVPERYEKRKADLLKWRNER